ncbi:MAG: hypothetical protein HYX94_00230 [Chloroflexi bacterium]|nr:hypothetical protein [Chloroflexota bacterium]
MLQLKARARFQVLVRVPKRAVVHRVHAHRAVVTPAVEAGHLGAGASDDGLLALHRAECVGRHPTGIPDGREKAVARCV